MNTQTTFHLRLPGAFLTMVMTIVIHVGKAMDTIKASDFKARCLALMDEVARSGKTLVVTKNGKPVAELRPHRAVSGSPLGAWAGQVSITGDILAPIKADWDALQ